ncbi:MAG: hypothetical protein WDN10_03360 [bacterium]
MSAWRVSYHSEVIAKDARSLDASVWKCVHTSIEQQYARMALPGKPLGYPLSDYRSLRVGDWRAIRRCKKDELIVLVLRHRSQGYGPDLLRALKRRSF